MQPLKAQFRAGGGGQAASFQSCIRTNDIEEVGDGSHLTSFTMVGSFGFGSGNYVEHCSLWARIVRRLGLEVTHVTFHPDTQYDRIWQDLGFHTTPDDGCTWSAGPGDPLSYCCELFCGELEIGNLVNPGGDSIDVGFGLERLVQMVEGVDRVDGSSMFNQSLSPVGRDHVRTIALLLENGVLPGNKGREYVCRRLMRRLLRSDGLLKDVSFYPLLLSEFEGLERRVKVASRDYRRDPNRPAEYWWGTHGIMAEDMHLL